MTDTETVPAYKETERVVLLPIEKLYIGTINKRRIRDRQRLDKLKQSILEKHRITKPLDVVPRDQERFEITDGGRRLTVAQELLAAGEKWLAELPCIVRMLSDTEAKMESLISNIHEGFTPFETALGLVEQLKEAPEHYPSQEALGKAVGMSQPEISKLLPLAKLNPKVGDRIRVDLTPV